MMPPTRGGHHGAQTASSTARARKGGGCITAIPTYRDADGNIAQFLPADGMPGCAHRVIVNRRKAGWLAEGHLPNAKAAAFFIGQVAEKEGEAGMAARRTEAASAMGLPAENGRHRALLSESDRGRHGRAPRVAEEWKAAVCGPGQKVRSTLLSGSRSSPPGGPAPPERTPLIG